MPALCRSYRLSLSAMIRCFYIAEMYRIAKKWGEATGLYDRCVTRATGALDQYKLLSEPNVKV